MTSTQDATPTRFELTPPHIVVPAATLIIFRDAGAGQPPELLMVERAGKMRFAAGAAVFPGGRVDEADRVLARRIAGADGEAIACGASMLAPLGDVELAARIAAIRETLEETGLAIGMTGIGHPDDSVEARHILLTEGTMGPVLERFGWRLDLQRLTPFAHWCPNHARAFDTRFYFTAHDAPAGQLIVDGTENTRLFWTSARDILAAAADNRAKLIFPTRRNLERLAALGSIDDAHAHVAQYPPRRITPEIVLRDGEEWLTIPEGLGYPVTSEPVATALRG